MSNKNQQAKSKKNQNALSQNILIKDEQSTRVNFYQEQQKAGSLPSQVKDNYLQNLAQNSDSIVIGSQIISEITDKLVEEIEIQNFVKNHLSDYVVNFSLQMTIPTIQILSDYDKKYQEMTVKDDDYIEMKPPRVDNYQSLGIREKVFLNHEGFLKYNAQMKPFKVTNKLKQMTQNSLNNTQSSIGFIAADNQMNKTINFAKLNKQESEENLIIEKARKEKNRKNAIIEKLGNALRSYVLQYSKTYKNLAIKINSEQVTTDFEGKLLTIRKQKYEQMDPIVIEPGFSISQERNSSTLELPSILKTQKKSQKQTKQGLPPLKVRIISTTENTNFAESTNYQINRSTNIERSQQTINRSQMTGSLLRRTKDSNDTQLITKFLPDSLRARSESANRTLNTSATLEPQINQIQLKSGVKYINPIRDQVKEGPTFSSRPNQMSRGKFLKISQSANLSPKEQKMQQKLQEIKKFKKTKEIKEKKLSHKLSFASEAGITLILTGDSIEKTDQQQFLDSANLESILQSKRVHFKDDKHRILLNHTPTKYHGNENQQFSQFEHLISRNHSENKRVQPLSLNQQNSKVNVFSSNKNLTLNTIQPQLFQPQRILSEKSMIQQENIQNSQSLNKRDKRLQLDKILIDKKIISQKSDSFISLSQHTSSRQQLEKPPLPLKRKSLFSKQ